MHAHSDLQLLPTPTTPPRSPRASPCEVLGQDGLSYAPVDDDDPGAAPPADRRLERRPARLRLVLAHGRRVPGPARPRASRSTPATWSRRARSGCSPSAGTTGRRRRRAGPDAAAGRRRAATRAPWACRPGSPTRPGMYADTEELAALCRVVAELGGYYCPHHRSYGAGALEAYAEMVDVVPQVRLRAASGPRHHELRRQPGRAAELLALLDARSTTAPTSRLDTYPYLPGSTTLAALLPSWAIGGRAGADPARGCGTPRPRDRIRHEMRRSARTAATACPSTGTPSRSPASAGTHNAEPWSVSTRRPSRRPARRGPCPPSSTSTCSLDDELGTTSCSTSGTRRTSGRSCGTASHTGGSDGLLVGDKPHPRAWGTFPRYLGHYVRELGVLSPGGVRAPPHRPRRPRGCGSATAGLVRDG